MDQFEVLRRPLITEKNTELQTQNKYTFEVADQANKPLVKIAVEKAFKVKVLAVNSVIVPGKTRRRARPPFTQEPWKKAVVTLQAGDKIQFFEGV